MKEAEQYWNSKEIQNWT